MQVSRLLFALVFAGLALTARTVRADDEQPTIISAHGDALGRATSAEALVEPKPSVPPNSAPPVIPSATVIAAMPSPAPPSVVAPEPAPIAGAPQAPPAPATIANTTSAAKTLPSPTSPPEPERGHAALIIAGAVLALAMFLWERRRKD